MSLLKFALGCFGVDTTDEGDIAKAYPSYCVIETAKESLKKRRVQIITDANRNKLKYDHCIHVDNVKAAVAKGVLPVYFEGKVVGTFNVERDFLMKEEGYVLCGELGLNKNADFGDNKGRFYLLCDYKKTDMSERSIKYYAVHDISALTITFRKP